MQILIVQIINLIHTTHFMVAYHILMDIKVKIGTIVPLRLEQAYRYIGTYK